MRRKTLKNALNRIEKEGVKQGSLMYSAAALALCRHWNKKRTAIDRLFEQSWEIWNDCAKDQDRSMLQICEEETGIEIQNGDGKSWHDLPYLNSSLDPGMMSEAQWLYMRQQQVKWVAPGIMACIIVTLHRRYGFRYDRCVRIHEQILAIEDEYGHDPQRLKEACRAETGINVIETLRRNG